MVERKEPWSMCRLGIGGRWLYVLAALGAVSVQLAASTVCAHIVRTRDGSEYEGKVELEVLRLKSDGGEIEVPRSALREVRRASDGALEVELTDASLMVGSPPSDAALRVEVGLVVRVVPFSEILLIRFAPPPADAELQEALRAEDFVAVDLVTSEMGKIEMPCPMRLALDLPKRLPTAKRGTASWRSGALKPFVCDSAVSVPQVIAEIREPKRGAGRLRLEFFVLVLPPQDKLSRLAVEILLDGEIVARGGEVGSTEEGRSTPVAVSIDLPAADFERWRAGVEKAELKLTLTAVDD